MRRYKCVVCDHVFEQDEGGDRPTCPICHSFYANDLGPVNSDQQARYELGQQQVRPRQTGWFDPQDGRDSEDLDIDLEQAIAFSEVDLKQFEVQVHASWRAEIGKQLKQFEAFENQLDTTLHSIREQEAMQTEISGKQPQLWEIYFAATLEKVPVLLRKLEITRQIIWRRWLAYIANYEVERQQSWKRGTDEWEKRQEAHKTVWHQGIVRVKDMIHQVHQKAEAEKESGHLLEEERRQEWQREYFRLTGTLRFSEEERRRKWNERFADPEQLWAKLRDERQSQLQQEHSAESRRRESSQDKISSERTLFDERCAFYTSKLASWQQALAKKEGREGSSD